MDTDRYSLRLSLRRFWSELARRKVWETLLAYGAVVFVLLQLGEIVLPAFSAPAWALPALVRCCFLGFPVVLALSWIFDLTPGGVRKTEYESKEAGGEEPAASTGLLPRFGLIVVTLATVGGLGWFTVRDTLATEAPSSSEAPSSGAGNELPASTTAEDVAVGSLAVLPLDDFSEEEGGEYFTAGLHEELVSQLSRIGSARILSRTSVVQFDRTGKTMPVIAEELGVEGVVEGSVFRAGDRVRITVQLIHGPTDRHLWANSYEGTLEDAIALQREVAGAIAREIQAELFPDDPLSTSTGRKAVNAAAQDAYLRARYAQSKGTPEDLGRAVRHYQAALEHDSSYVPAYAGLAASRLLLSLETADSLPGNPTVLDSSVTAPLTKALALDERSPEARAVLLALGRSFGTLPEGELARKSPLLLDSSMVLGTEFGVAGTELGRQLQRSLVRKERDLLRWQASPRLLEGALHLRLAGDHEEAENALREIVRRQPEELGAWRALESVMAMRGKIGEAIQVHRECVEANGSNPGAVADLERLEVLFREQGARGYWTWNVARLQEEAARGGEVSAVEMARSHMALGHREKAFDLLARALDESDRTLLTVWIDPVWDPVRHEAEFRTILADVRKKGGGRKHPGLSWPLP